MKTIVTHNGSFHTDDVFAVATLKLFLGEEEVKVVRTRDQALFATADYCVDVGGVYDLKTRRFDHHQTGGAGIRDNGIPYASFGLVWKEYGAKIAGSEEVAQIIENKLVLFVDSLDNGKVLTKPIYEDIRDYTISDYLYSFWIDEDVSPSEVDRIFHRGVSMAKDLIKREIAKADRIIEEGKVVEGIYNESKDKRLIILDSHLPWGKILTDKPEPLIVVYPGLNDGTWNAKAVRVSLNTFDMRKLFPESWSGKTGNELAKASGVVDAVFCHTARFLAVAKSKEGAIAMAKIAIDA